MGKEYRPIHNEKLLRFEIHEGDSVAFLVYKYHKKDIAFMHTEVPENMEGRGVASALTKYAFEFAKSKNKLVMIYCPFVGAYLK
ncbi:MAG: N-acetyltransferase, partial [Bacteroidota bacterium]|nr:N-acetyltransferase [Bacteroidota bacterium]